MAGERAARVWAWIAAAREGDAPVSLAALCRAAVARLGVDGASVKWPCLDCYRTGEAVIVSGIRSRGAAARWPRFAAAAHEMGYARKPPPPSGGGQALRRPSVAVLSGTVWWVSAVAPGRR